MADKKISALTSLAQNDIDTTADVLPIVDTNATETKKSTPAAIVNSVAVAGIPTLNATTVDATNVEVTNIKAKDGTAAATIADSTGIVSLSANPILSGGTANGVLYLNGSKVATSGSALTFDGTTLGVNTGVVAGTALSLTGNYVASGSVAFINFQRVGGAVAGTLGYDDANIAIRFGTTTNHSTIFLQNNSEAMRLTSTGLGIGTSSPTQKLDVTGTGNTTARIGADGSSETALHFGNTTIGRVSVRSAAPLAFETGATERMRLDSSGNLGLGVTPSAWVATRRAFQLSTSLSIWSTTSAASFASFGANVFDNGSESYINTGAASKYNQSNGVHSWHIASSGTAGNTISFTQAMTLEQSTGDVLLTINAANNADAKLVFSEAGAAEYSIIMDGLSGSTQSLQFYNNRTATEAMRISSAGNLGIGTSSPAVPLDVVSNSGSNGINIRARSSNDYGFLNFKSNDGSDTVGSIAALRAGVNSGSLLFYTGTTEKARLDTSGNLGIGTSSPQGPLDVAASGVTVNQFLTGGAGNNAVTGIFKIGSGAGRGASIQGFRGGSSNVHSLDFYTYNSADVFGMRLDSSGNLGIGTSSPGARLDLRRPDSGVSGPVIEIGDNTAGSSGRYGGIGYSAVSPYPVQIWGGSLSFLTGSSTYSSATERARITSGGYSKFSNDGTYYGPTGSYHEFISTLSGENILRLDNEGSPSPYGIEINFSGASPDNNTQWFLRCADSTTTRCYIWSDGDLANHDGVYGTISDERLKQDIVDAPSQWDDLKAVRFRKYRMKSDVAADPNAPSMLGVVAQELEQVCPGLVEEHPDMEMVEVTDEEGNVTQTQQPTGTTTKTVKSSILLMKAAVALQEAMARIEKLEAEMAALKGA